MERVLHRDKRKGKEKIEEADQESLLPKSNSDIVDQFFFLKLEGDLRFEDAVGPVTRREFLVRYKDIPCFLGEEDETLKRIQMASGATIGLVTDPQVRFHRQAHLELWGTVDEVKIAELLIVDATTEIYGKSFVPTTLMPPNICRNEVYIPLLQATHLLGLNDENILTMEARSGAWIQVDPIELPSAGEPWMRRINIFGSHEQISRVMFMINKIVHVETLRPEEEAYVIDHQESAKLEDESKQNSDSEHAKEARDTKSGNSNVHAALKDKGHVELVLSLPNSNPTTI